MTEPFKSADIHLIQRIIPHRYPFLLVDKVVDIDGFQRARGIKNVTMNEPHFQGHFPGKPIMPGVTIVEAMAQTAAVMVGTALGMEDAELLRRMVEYARVVPSPGKAFGTGGAGGVSTGSRRCGAGASVSSLSRVARRNTSSVRHWVIVPVSPCRSSEGNTSER